MIPKSLLDIDLIVDLPLMDNKEWQIYQLIRSQAEPGKDIIFLTQEVYP